MNLVTIDGWDVQEKHDFPQIPTDPLQEKGNINQNNNEAKAQNPQFSNAAIT